MHSCLSFLTSNPIPMYWAASSLKSFSVKKPAFTLYLINCDFTPGGTSFEKICENVIGCYLMNAIWRGIQEKMSLLDKFSILIPLFCFSISPSANAPRTPSWFCDRSCCNIINWMRERNMIFFQKTSDRDIGAALPHLVWTHYLLELQPCRFHPVDPCRYLIDLRSPLWNFSAGENNIEGLQFPNSVISSNSYLSTTYQ